MIALREADAVIAGPLATEDANAPGLLPHLADLASRPTAPSVRPVELVSSSRLRADRPPLPFHPDDSSRGPRLGCRGRRYQYPGQRLRRLQGDPGEFAITVIRQPRATLGRTSRLVGNRADREFGRVGRRCCFLRGMGRRAAVPPCRCGAGTCLCPCRNSGGARRGYHQADAVSPPIEVGWTGRRQEATAVLLQTIRLCRITSAYHRLLSLGVRRCVPNATWTMPNRFS